MIVSLNPANVYFSLMLIKVDGSLGPTQNWEDVRDNDIDLSMGVMLQRRLLAINA